MKKLNMMRSIFISVILLTMVLPAAKAAVADECFEDMPDGCFVIQSDTISSAQTDAIGKKLGAPLKSLSNTRLRIQGKPVQVNILETETVADAEKLHQTISAMKGHPAFCLILGTRVIEFCKAEVSTAIKTAYELGFTPKPKQIQYRITARVSTIDKADYSSFNRLSNAFFQTDTQNPGQESIAAIRNLSRNFTFGTSITLRKQSGESSAYEFTPVPTESRDESGGRITYSFSQTPDVLGVPCVVFKSKIVCDESGLTPTDQKVDKSLLSATDYWPVDDPQIQTLAERITSGEQTQDAKVQAILEWLTPGKHIKAEGPAGSRWGVKEVLKQKFGHCWDSSDCFVTLARASGIPSRQVGGWLYGTGGHIWAEVLIAGKGWQQVDPTGGGRLSCGIYHIPYFTTETGEMPILYLSMPQIEISETEL